jgi:hypothetical protein
MEASYEKLRTKLLTVFGKPQRPRAIVIGGGDDLCKFTAEACIE